MPLPLRVLVQANQLPLCPEWSPLLFLSLHRDFCSCTLTLWLATETQRSDKRGWNTTWDGAEKDAGADISICILEDVQEEKAAAVWCSRITGDQCCAPLHLGKPQCHPCTSKVTSEPASSSSGQSHCCGTPEQGGQKEPKMNKTGGKLGFSQICAEGKLWDYLCHLKSLSPQGPKYAPLWKLYSGV